MLPSICVAQALNQRASLTPEHVVLVTAADGSEITAAELKTRAESVAAGFSDQGIRAGDRIVTILNNDIDHVAVFLAACLIDAIWIPVNPQTRGPALSHILTTARPTLLIVEDELVPGVRETTGASENLNLHTRSSAVKTIPGGVDVSRVTNEEFQQGEKASLDTLRCVIFTSGTTGPPKGVMVTERMLMAAAFATGLASNATKDDAYLFWEPLHHIGGSQLVILALLEEIRLIQVPRFSASRFWTQVRDFGVTKLHYLGGLLDILLATPETADEKFHPITLGFGGGARPATWTAFQQRFAIPLNEVYGMTEASSFSTLNDSGIVGSIGKSLPWFKLALLDTDGDEVNQGEIGELVVSDQRAGLITPGYLDNPAETAELIRDGQLWTGDLMRRDEDANFWFVGRRRDFIRRRGENVSAWEVEQLLNQHPDIVEAAVVGVDSTIGEQDIHAYVQLENTDTPLSSVFSWCTSRLGRHQLPRYWSTVSEFDRTPSQRIIKNQLAARKEEIWDSETEN